VTRRISWANAFPRYSFTGGGKIIRQILMPNGRWEEEKFEPGPSPFEGADFSYLEGVLADLYKRRTGE
jgi:hypothetical protein